MTDKLVADNDERVQRHYVGKLHARTRLGEETDELLKQNVNNILSVMLNSVAF